MDQKLKKHVFPAFLTHSREEFLEKLGFVREYFEHPFLHLDVMDGTFVPHFCWCNSIDISKLNLSSPFEVHLMTDHPERRITAWKKCGASRIHFHIEATQRPLEVIAKIHNAHMQAGVALNANTPIEKIALILPHADAILIMGIQPGNTGKHFHKNVYKKIATLHRAHGKKPIIIDGGVTLRNAKKLLRLGATHLVSTSALYPKKILKKFKTNRIL